MVQLSLEELKSVLKLLKDKKRKKRSKAKKRKRPTTGYEMGGLKSDSSHLQQGYSTSMPFSNTQNQSTELMALQRNILENQLKNPDRFDRQSANNNLLTKEDFRRSMNIFGSQLGNYYDTRLNTLEDKANQLSSDLGYSIEDFIKNRQNKAYIEQLPDDEDKQFNTTDNIDVAITQGSDYFKDQGNKIPYAETEADNPFYVSSPMHEQIIKEQNKVQEPYFENTDIYGNTSGKAEIQSLETPSPKPKSIMKKITKYFTPTETETIEQPQQIKPTSIGEKVKITIPKKDSQSEETRKAIELNQLFDSDTEWYKQNVKNIISIEATDGLPKGVAGDIRFRELLFNLGVPLQDIDNYLNKNKYTQKRELYRSIYNKVRANNNKILKRQEKDKEK